jgi:hypothetical protein
LQMLEIACHDFALAPGSDAFWRAARTRPKNS